MRGKACEMFLEKSRYGITPAYAGKRALRASWKCLLEDHPRLCGEKYVFTFIDFQFEGSPPPMRGKGRSSRKVIPNSRITPAYAGKSSGNGLIPVPSWDHPRLCGEKPSQTTASRYKRGSPPPMRGKVHFPEYRKLSHGITPAYAGKSSTHLRAFFHFVGSPPPMRGKVHIVIHTIAIIRITPAYAGKSVAGIAALIAIFGITPAYAGKRRRFCSLTVAI